MYNLLGFVASVMQFFVLDVLIKVVVQFAIRHFLYSQNALLLPLLGGN